MIRELAVLVGVLAPAGAMAQPQVCGEPAELAGSDPFVVPMPAARAAPADVQRRALAEGEAEATALERAARGYGSAVQAILRREHERRRRNALLGWQREIDAETREEIRARDEAIRRMEAFLRRHPRDEEHTPATMARLGELYFDRVAEDEAPDLEPVIALYRDLIARFPRYERIDAALYLLGWALDRGGREAEAADVWRRLVCANGAAEYAACVARDPGSAFLAETWVRLGERHFDEAELDRATAAYGRALEDRGSPLHALALYKLAWTHYRAMRYPDALARFGELLDLAAGGARVELRDEAIQYTAIVLAWDDWDEDGRRSPPSEVMARIDDGRLLPRDRAWTPEVLARLVDVLAVEVRRDEAVHVWRVLRTRHSSHPAAISAGVRLVRELDSSGASERAFEVLDELVALAEPSGADEARRVEALAEDLLRMRAFRRHRQAQAVRRTCTADPSPACLARVTETYRATAEAYRQWLGAYPNRPDADEVRLALAAALYLAGDYPEAARIYTAARDEVSDPRLRAEAARGAVTALGRVVDAEMASGALVLPQQPPDVASAAAIPPRLVELGRAREIAAAFEPSGSARAATWAWQNARLLHLYGRWEAAAPRLDRVWRTTCGGADDEDVAQSGAFAWDARRGIARAMRAGPDAERLDREVISCGCTFAARGQGPSAAALHVLARALASAGRGNESARAAERILAAAARLEDPAARAAMEADAHFRVAQQAERTGDAERAARHYTAAADAVDARARAGARALPELDGLRREAARNAAILLDREGSWSAAAVAYRRAASLMEHASERRDLRFRAADMLGRTGDRSGMVREMRLFAEAHAGEPGAGALVVEARARIMDALPSAQARADLLAAYAASGEGPGSPAAAHAARARLANADDEAGRLLRGLVVRPVAARTAQQWGASLRDETRRAAERASGAVSAYEQVVALGSPASTIAAVTRQGDAQESLARAITQAPFVVPRDVRAQLARLPREEREAILEEIRATYDARLDELARPVECQAIGRWLLALRLARRAGIASPDADRSLARLRAHGSERVGRCLGAVSDGLEPLQAGELDPVTTGRVRELEGAPPRLD